MMIKSKNSMYVKILEPKNKPNCPPISPVNKKNKQFTHEMVLLYSLLFTKKFVEKQTFYFFI